MRIPSHCTKVPTRRPGSSISYSRKDMAFADRLEAALKTEIQSPQRLGDSAIVYGPAHYRRETLVERGRIGDLLERNIRG
jgi:hypothetical protein